MILIRTYAPDTYNTYEYNIGDDTKIISQLLTYVLIFSTHKERFNNYIYKNDAELSGADTDTDE